MTILNQVNIDRTPMKDITLADGTLLPKGAFVSIAMGPLMRDKDIYGEDADKFDPFRFSDRRSQEGGENRNQLVMINSEFLAFGMGKRAW
jgi:cytochrome P450